MVRKKYKSTKNGKMGKEKINWVTVGFEPTVYRMTAWKFDL
jgi:hypothetical protein